MSSARLLRVAATQFACSWDLEANLRTAEQLVREAAGAGAQLILLQELFATPYFCIEQDPAYLSLAEPASSSAPSSASSRSGASPKRSTVRMR